MNESDRPDIIAVYDGPMSADNYLVSIPTRGGRIGLYEVSHSDCRINVDDPDHVLCPAVHAHALRMVGTYTDEVQLSAAIKREYEQGTIEYPPVLRHQPAARRAPRPRA